MTTIRSRAVDDLGWRDVPEAILHETALSWVEHRVGSPLPEAYVYAALHYHGAVPDKCQFVVPSGRPYGSLLGVLLDPREDAVEDSIGEEWSGMGELASEALVPFACDGGGDLICLDYRIGSPPRVVYFEHETGDLIDLAPSFEEFVGSLYAGSDSDSSELGEAEG